MGVSLAREKLNIFKNNLYFKEGVNKMKKRFTACMLAFAVIASQVLNISVFAQSGRNAYNHTVIYQPVTSLYTDGEALKFFDAKTTAWGKLGDSIIQSESESIKWLSKNNYLLNHFGRKSDATVNIEGCFNLKGEWQTALKGPTNVRRWYANVFFDSLSDKNKMQNGNISNLYDKGDIQYFFSWKVKTVQTRWGLTGKSNDTGLTYILDETTKSSGGGWKKYNTLSDGPNLGNFSAWKNGKDLTVLSFMADSDKDNKVNSYLSGAMLVGRDIKGPKISSVKVTADIDGKNEIENGTITLDTIEKLKDRTVYFQVQWDEPVVFGGISDDEIGNISLNVETLGIDGTSGIKAEAPFIKFAPSKTNSKPVMVFEYKIADPYTDSSKVAQERGFFYKFSNVTVSENENKEFWNNIYDISGNKFASDENGIQPGGKVVTPVSNSAKVDLIPFGIKSISAEKTYGNNEFIALGESFSINLNLNKSLPLYTKKENLPKLTLNVKNADGKNIILDAYDYSLDSVKYKTYFKRGYTIDDTTVKVISVSSEKGKLSDQSGYSFMNYNLNGNILYPTDIPSGAASKKEQYGIALDKQYKLDFEAPIITDLSVSEREDGIIAISALTEDDFIAGCDMSFTVKTDGNTANDGIDYMASSNNSYNNAEWIKGKSGTTIVSFSSPIVESNGKGVSYGFIKLPQNSEATLITVDAVAIDEAKNSSKATTKLASPEWDGYDTLAPTVRVSVTHEDISVDIDDIDNDVTYEYGFSDDYETEPLFETATGKHSVIPAPDLPNGNAVYEKILWVKAKDSHGNESAVSKTPVTYDRTATDITYNTDTEKEYITGDYPFVEFWVKKAVSFWYTWAEKPVNVSDTAAFIADKYLDDMKARAVEYGCVYDPEAIKNPVVQFSDTTPVAVINPNDESYGGDILPSETSRPIMLIIAAEREDGSTLVKTIEFNTFYGAPNVKAIQTRYSTNNSAGKRVDYIRNSDGSGLLWPSDELDNPTNTPDIFGFAQAEIQLLGDPATNFNRVDMQKSFVTLKKVLYNNGSYDKNDIYSSNIIQKWDFGELDFVKSMGNKMSAVLNIDINNINAQYFEVEECVDETFGDIYTVGRAVRYELECNMVYTNESTEPQDIPIAYYAFNNTPNAFLNSAYNTDTQEYYYNEFKQKEKKNTEAVFDLNGNDVTYNIPVYTVSTSETEDYGGNEYIDFVCPAHNYYGINNLYYGTPVQNKADPNNTAKLKLHIGDDPKNLSSVLEFKSNGYDYCSEPFDIGRYLFGNKNKICEVKLYYRFEHSERGTFSPLYVIIIRKDNVSPVFDISVSETERLTDEVLVKLNSVTDTQTSADGTIIVDTTEQELTYNQNFHFSVIRELTENDDISQLPEDDILRYMPMGYDEKTGETIYIDCISVNPDDDGIYHITSKGYITAFAEDNARNVNDTVLINGRAVKTQYIGGMDFPSYVISNVSNERPQFDSEPVFTREAGKFTVNAKADKTVKNVYLKFNKEYSDILAQNDLAENGLYNIENVPGIAEGGFNSETGDVAAEIYVKYSENVSLTNVSVIIENTAGGKTEYPYTFTAPVTGIKTQVANAENENGYPVWEYGKTLDFTTPVKLNGTDAGYALSYKNVPIYSDGITQIEYTDLFGESFYEDILSNIFGTAFAHNLKFTAGGKEILPKTKVADNVTVTVDTSKTNNLSVVGDKTEFLFEDNGILSYSLTNSQLKQTREFNIPITNIDKTAPEAIITINTESERDIETGKQTIYAVTYSVEGFSEDNVELIPSKEGSAPSSITFDSTSDILTYTFKFRDEAGNEGSYTADASDIVFAQRIDSTITNYRLTYKVSDNSGFNTIGEFTANESVNLGLINKEISVKVEALNQSGDVVSSAVSVNGELPQGVFVYEKQKLVMFTGESSKDRIVNLTLTGADSANSIIAAVMLPANTLDFTAPTGTVNYKADNNNVKAYLVTDAADLAENGIYVTGTKTDGTAFELKKDDNGYYTELDLNGTGKFVLIDKAGNIGTVSIVVLTIDSEPPKIISEGWQSLFDAKTKEEIKNLLNTPTNNTIKLFITFNEQLSGVNVTAYEDSENANILTPTDEYVTAFASGNSLTVEFKKNCRAKLAVYDLRGNEITLWRPEDGPVTVIDRDIPKLAEGYPNIALQKNNTVTIKYVFADGDEVMLLQNEKDGFKNEHTVTFDKNGTFILNFADKANNVFSHYPVISGIDTLGPDIKMNVDYYGDGTVLSNEDAYKAGNIYTNKNVRILLNVDDETKDGITVSAKNKLGKSIDVKKETVTLNGKTYSYSIIVSENGSYKITAADKWNNENCVETSVSVIDKTAPSIKTGKDFAAIKRGTSQDETINKILAEVSAADLQSGANNPVGDAVSGVSDGVKLKILLDDVKLDTVGKYTAKICASDRLGNISYKDYTVFVMDDIYTFNVGGKDIYANDVYTASKGKVCINNANIGAKYYYSKGYKTAAQMKYAKGFDPENGFDALEKGYYTVLAQEMGRKMYLLYVYIY